MLMVVPQIDIPAAIARIYQFRQDDFPSDGDNFVDLILSIFYFFKYFTILFY